MIVILLITVGLILVQLNWTQRSRGGEWFNIPTDVLFGGVAAIALVLPALFLFFHAPAWFVFLLGALIYAAFVIFTKLLFQVEDGVLTLAMHFFVAIMIAMSIFKSRPQGDVLTIIFLVIVLCIFLASLVPTSFVASKIPWLTAYKVIGTIALVAIMGWVLIALLNTLGMGVSL